MYVILTSKPGQFRTEITDGVRPMESYDYLFYGSKKAHFVIAELLEDTKIRIIDETWSQPVVNDIPSKLLEKFETPEDAFAELRNLTTFGDMTATLKKC